MGVIFETVGWLGAGLLLVTYALTARGRLNPKGARAAVCNIAASVGLAANTWYHGSLPGTALNTTWGIIALVALVSALRSMSTRHPD